jgi:hypothetical protein
VVIQGTTPHPDVSASFHVAALSSNATYNVASRTLTPRVGVVVVITASFRLQHPLELNGNDSPS